LYFEGEKRKSILISASRGGSKEEFPSLVYLVRRSTRRWSQQLVLAAQESSDEFILEHVSRALASLTPSARHPRQRILQIGAQKIEVRELDVSQPLLSCCT
jgi:hypothetical protein